MKTIFTLLICLWATVSFAFPPGFLDVATSSNAVAGGPQTQYRSPTGDNNSVWDTSSGTDRYALVDDSTNSTNDGDETYITKTAAAANQKFTFGNFSISGTTVNSVTVNSYCRGAGNIYLKHSLGITSSNTNYLTSNSRNITTSAIYQVFSTSWTLNPKTGVAWTFDDINHISANYIASFGLDISGITSGETVYCTNTWIEVSYE